jgi:hypothetical protein
MQLIILSCLLVSLQLALCCKDEPEDANTITETFRGRNEVNVIIFE